MNKFEYDRQNRRVVWHINSLDGTRATVKYYNNAGYPVKAEVYDGTTEALVRTHEYSYKKAN